MYTGSQLTHVTYRSLLKHCPPILNTFIVFLFQGRGLPGNRPNNFRKKPYQPDTVTHQLTSSSQNINGKPKTTDICEKIQKYKTNQIILVEMKIIQGTEWYT